ncbi:hypothetical protein CASFOL_008939 [Castilleja foliolosa]|uniref:Uncharacterized protein n=1 Tax=Castilleja foliolosa TaxID=1961234 RepID=A0ABD3E1I4_9LAMI
MNSTSQQDDVENLTVSFGKAPSTPNYLEELLLRNPGYSVGPRERECNNEEAMISEEAVHCRSCKKDHATYAYYYCPYTPCNICFRTGHDPWVCPYLRNIPKGAKFDTDNYFVSCQCGGGRFDVDKWVCTHCPGYPRLLRRL